MTQITRIICDCCKEEQQIINYMEFTYLHLTRGGFPYDDDDRPTHLCHDCAKKVFDFIKSERKIYTNNKQRD